MKLRSSGELRRILIPINLPLIGPMASIDWFAIDDNEEQNRPHAERFHGYPSGVAPDIARLPHANSMRQLTLDLARDISKTHVPLSRPLAAPTIRSVANFKPIKLPSSPTANFHIDCVRFLKDSDSSTEQ